MTPLSTSGRTTSAPPHVAPRRVGSWELVSLAGTGSLCCVYRARPAEGAPGRPSSYAVKVLREEHRDSTAARACLRREANVGRSVSHPRLVSVLASQTTAPPLFLVFPWLDGAPLSKLLADTGRLALPTALWIARQTCEALEALHQAGWLHGDVKPSNLFISPAGHVTLIDLGFASRPHERGSELNCAMRGTIEYLAPEALTSTVRPDIRSDLYSLGIVLYEMLAGRLPFQATTAAELATCQLRDTPPDLRRLNAHLPTSVARLVRECLAKEPLRRPQTPDEFSQRLLTMEIETFAER